MICSLPHPGFSKQEKNRQGPFRHAMSALASQRPPGAHVWFTGHGGGRSPPTIVCEGLWGPLGVYSALWYSREQRTWRFFPLRRHKLPCRKQLENNTGRRTTGWIKSQKVSREGVQLRAVWRQWGGSEVLRGQAGRGDRKEGPWDHSKQDVFRGRGQRVLLERELG